MASHSRRPCFSYCKYVVFKLGTVGEKVYREVVYRDVVYREVVYREVVYREVVYREVVYREVVYREVVYREVVYREVVYNTIHIFHIISRIHSFWQALHFEVSRGLC